MNSEKDQPQGAAPPTSETVIDPAMADFLGEPDAQVEDQDRHEAMPDDLKELFDKHGLSDKSYDCALFFYSEESSQAVNLENFSRRYPDVMYVGKRWGPGRYELRFHWRGSDTQGQRRRWSETIAYPIPESYRDIHEDFMFDWQIERARKGRDKLRRASIRQKLELPLDLLGGDGNGKADPLKTTKESMEMFMQYANLLGFNRQEAKKGIDWEKIAPILVAAIPAFFKMIGDGSSARRADQMQLLTMMTSMGSNNTTQLMEVMKTINGPQKGSDLMEEMTKMILGAMDIKERLADSGKESVTDKIFGAIERVAPMIMAMTMMPKEQRQAQPMYNAAKAYVDSDENFQTVMADPQKSREVIGRLDESFGWAQTDIILEIGGFERPQDCVRDPVKQFPKGTPERQQMEADASREPTEAEAEVVATDGTAGNSAIAD